MVCNLSDTLLLESAIRRRMCSGPLTSNARATENEHSPGRGSREHLAKRLVRKVLIRTSRMTPAPRLGERGWQTCAADRESGNPSRRHLAAAASRRSSRRSAVPPRHQETHTLFTRPEKAEATRLVLGQRLDPRQRVRARPGGSEVARNLTSYLGVYSRLESRPCPLPPACGSAHTSSLA